MQDAWRAYLELALGLTEASRRKAEKVARDLLDKGGSTASQAQSMVEDLLATSRANREELTKLVRFEVERTMGKLGLATAEEVGQLAARVQELERRLAETTPQPLVPAQSPPAQTPAATPTAAAPAKKTTKKAVKKATKQTPEKPAVAKKATKKATKNTTPPSAGAAGA
ncbi:phasin family protein [Natronosporangium hydrolyticum]|uniref:Phasin family protein n=1 Tax=Natronosporangium hydrolyticum TaxID=2811111 RepID=A0A895Y4G0_9ACTN|nr:phasin family protein [Natronosporangium hydrolyticum]QSB12584.1 phasin family protein [Natronosporangium hydrolyticum]